jgi:hypothetical protein
LFDAILVGRDACGGRHPGLTAEPPQRPALRHGQMSTANYL